jgi:hypothetical protein
LGSGRHLTVAAQGMGLEIRLDKSGANDHDVNTVCLELRPQGCEEAVQRMFAGAIARPTQQWRDAGQTFNHDNVSLAFNQTVDGSLGTVQRSEKVDLHDPAVNADLGIGKCAALGNAGIVDEYVDAAKSLNYGIYSTYALDFINHITWDADRIHPGMSEFIRGSSNTRFIHVQQTDPGPCPGKSPADGRTDAAGRPGYDHDVVFKITIYHDEQCRIYCQFSL